MKISSIPNDKNRVYNTFKDNQKIRVAVLAIKFPKIFKNKKGCCPE